MLTLRSLLAGVTRVLLLADNVVVKQLLLAVGGGAVDGHQSPKAPKDIAEDVAGASLNTMNLFTEFVKAFCDFGMEMLQLITVIGKQKKTVIPLTISVKGEGC